MLLVEYSCDHEVWVANLVVRASDLQSRHMTCCLLSRLERRPLELQIWTSSSAPPMDGSDTQPKISRGAFVGSWSHLSTRSVCVDTVRVYPLNEGVPAR